MDTLPASCRQRLVATGQPYPKSSCEACGVLSPKWKECEAEIAKRLNSADSLPSSSFSLSHPHFLPSLPHSTLLSLLKDIALISHGGGLIGFDSQAEALRKIRKITKPFLGDELNKLQQPDQNQEAYKEHAEFHLQPGDQCRLLDGPFMIYLGTEEHDGQAHCFAYWGATNGTDELVTIYLKPSVARFAKKAGQ